MSYQGKLKFKGLNRLHVIDCNIIAFIIKYVEKAKRNSFYRVEEKYPAEYRNRRKITKVPRRCYQHPGARANTKMEY